MMSGVAAGAGCRDGQTALQQSLAVNALGIVLNDLVLGADVTHGSFLTLAVAARAKCRNVSHKRRGGRILLAQNAVRTMTLLAAGCIGIFLAEKLAMSAPEKLPSDFIVAGGAVDRVGDGFAGPQVRGIYLGVALAAGDFAVAGVLELGSIDKHGVAIPRAPQRLVRMATHTIGIGHALCVKDLADFVRLMTIHAGRKYVGLLFPQDALDDLPVYGLNLRVALRTSCRNVSSGDGGCGVRMGENQMGGVATCTGGGYNKSFLKQAFPMDALGIVLQDVGLRNGAEALNRGSLAVTPATHERHL